MNNPWPAVAAIVAGYAALLGGAYAVLTVPLRRAMNRAFRDRPSISTPLEAGLSARLARLPAQLDDHAERMTRLEERTSPPRRN